MIRFPFTFFAIILCIVVCECSRADDIPTQEDLDFFEKRIRPLLVDRCYECHSSKAKSLKGGLRVDSRTALLDGGDTGLAVVVGDPDESLMIRAVRYEEEDLEMPPSGKLSDSEIKLLSRWIELGVPMPETNNSGRSTHEGIDFESARKFWSFQQPKRYPLPHNADQSWAAQPIDAFVLAKLEHHVLHPSRAADLRTLIRRSSFDLIGLPPSPEEVHRFVYDDSPDAYSRLIDHLLASPRHGERWGRFWLDHARYTDKTATWLELAGQAYLFRDWVIEALNADMPYDQFVRRQLATDMMPETEPEDLPALGFLALSPTYWKELRLAPDVIKTVVAEEWEERIDAVGRTFLGLTLACARCHEHKFDPVSQEDYYGLAGVFASIRLADRPLVSDEDAELIEMKQATIKQLQQQIKTLTAMDIDGKSNNRIAELTAQISYLKLSTPNLDAPMANVVEESSLYVMPDGPEKTKLEFKPSEPRDVAVQIRGNPAKEGPIVPRRFLTVLSSTTPPTPFQNGSGRLELANAIVSDGAHLSARVIVNRVWKHHFGHGLVATPSNFGTQGERPTHPELLDDLTSRFMQDGWSIKQLHRKLMLSATYKQQTSADSANRKRNPESIDPSNQLLWRMNRRRLKIEAWRDAMLLVSGILDSQIGGAPIGLSERNNRRRTIYGTVHRRDLDSMLQMHDFPDPTAHSPTRKATTTPLQQLFVLNSPFMQQQANAFVARLKLESSEDTAARVHHAYRLFFARMPTESEFRMAVEFLGGGQSDKQTAHRWQQFAQVLLGSNEFLFID